MYEWTHTHIHAYTQDNYSNPRCACAPRVNDRAKSSIIHIIIILYIIINNDIKSTEVQTLGTI